LFDQFPQTTLMNLMLKRVCYVRIANKISAEVFSESSPENAPENQQAAGFAWYPKKSQRRVYFARHAAPVPSSPEIVFVHITVQRPNEMILDSTCGNIPNSGAYFRFKWNELN
jgi:hypothetical protein